MINGVAAIVPAARNMISGTLLTEGVAAIGLVDDAVAAATQVPDRVAASVLAATASAVAVGIALDVAAKMMASAWRRKVEMTKLGEPESATEPAVVAAPFEFAAPAPVTRAVPRAA